MLKDFAIGTSSSVIRMGPMLSLKHLEERKFFSPPPSLPLSSPSFVLVFFIGVVTFLFWFPNFY